MKFRDVNNMLVVDVDATSITDAGIDKLETLLKEKAHKKSIGLNLKNVTVVSHNFGRLLKEFSQKSKLSLFNLNNESLLFLYIAKYDQSANIYLSEEDFCTDKHSFVNRRFKVLAAE